MTDYEALGIVLDLALQNSLDDSDEMQEEFRKQQEAIDRIALLLDTWYEENTTP